MKSSRRNGTHPEVRFNDPELISLMRLVKGARFLEVEKLARRMLNRQPNHSLAQKALSFALVGLARYEEVLSLLDFVIVRSPDDGELFNNRGIALSSLRRWEESIRDFERARNLIPDDPEILKNLGLALVRMDKSAEAIPVLLQAIEKHSGDYVEAVSLLADALANCKRVEEAWICYEELYKADSENLYALFQLVSVGLHRGDWSGLTTRIATLREASEGFSKRGVGQPFGSFAFPGVSPAEHRLIASVYAPVSEAVALIQIPSAAQRKLKIAYISGDFRRHPVGAVITEVIDRHDRNRFEVLAYSTTPDDGSPLRQRLRRAFDQFIDVTELSAYSCVARIRADQPDILIDLSGWTAHGRTEALAMRCAPVQVNWLGYPGTLGGSGIADYIVGDPVVTPLEDSAFFSECIAQLPNCYLPYDTTRALGTPKSRADYGLPDESFVFCSFNATYKYNPPVFDVWCSILRDASGSVLWLNQASEEIKTRLRDEAVSRGIAAERLIFAERVDDDADYLARNALADLALDPFPYNAHSTGLDTLWSGVPMVSLRGKTFAGRVGASMLRAAGLDGLIAENEEQYVSIALALHHDKGALEQYRAQLGLAKDGSALFDTKRFTDDLEVLYLRMWQAASAGEFLPLAAR